MHNYWKEKKVFNVNTIDRYASGFPLDEKNNKKIKFLNGDWKFKFVENATLVPTDFFEEYFDYSDFDKIKVPSEWQLQGYDTPMYTNIVYPYAIETANLLAIPKIHAKRNPVGLYVCEFELDELKDKYFINFGGINSNGEIYLNNEFVGYSEDTFDCQEYDVTPYVKTGKNVLKVMVARYCTGSYLEDQDMWRLSGIFRDVILINKPVTEISDIFATSVFKNGGYDSAELTVRFDVANLVDNCEVLINVFDGNEVVKTSKICDVTNKNQVEFDFDKVKPWSHEFPNLYKIEITLYIDGKFTDKRAIRFGFREIKTTRYENGKAPMILLNGIPLKIKGVNRHEFHPEHGHAVPEELIRKDLEIIKANNINAIRNSHYPNSRAFYDLCDEMGILVMCENNLETHGLSMIIPRNSKYWTEQCIYRINNMVNTYKNHACIISWSLGNEAGFGTAFVEMRKAVLAIDTTRFIHYEEDTSCKVSDVFSEMYAQVQKMKYIGENKRVMHCFMTVFRPLGVVYTSKKYRDLPYMQCEYAHCMGNSLGNFSDYWEEFYKYDRLCGGFIWDFADQAIKVVKDGQIRYLYGGDFGEKPNAGVFAFNGIVKADRTPNPALYEVKKVYQPIHIKGCKNEITLINRYMFTTVNDGELKLTFLKNGIAVGEQTIRINDLQPNGGVSAYKFEYAGNKEDLSEDFTVLAEVIYGGSVIAYEQYKYNDNDVLGTLPDLSGDCTVNDTEWETEIIAGNIKVMVDKKTGGITSISINGAERLRAPVMPNFVRPTINNDSWMSVDNAFVKWIMGVYKFHKSEKTMKPKKFNVSQENGVVKIVIDWKFRYGKLVTKYDIAENGINMELKVRPNTELVRYGFKFATRKEITDMTFYANGPFENYCDRKSAAVLREYKGVATDFNHEYLYPQENGNHTDARYLKLGTSNNGIDIFAIDAPFEFCVLPYSLEKLEAGEHEYEMVKDDHYTVTIDGKQRGVGGDVPAIASLKPQYKIKRNKDYSLKVRLTIK